VTPYREKAERPEAPPSSRKPVGGLRCTRCDVPVSPEDGRCPQCLRRSTVAGPGVRGSNAEEIDALRVWPVTDRCPVCGERAVGASRVFLRIAKTASDFGTRTASLRIALRTCDPCHARVVRLDRLRPAAAGALILGLFATFGFFLPTLAGVGSGALGVALVVGALVAVGRENRRLRARLDDAGITDVVSDLVPQPGGLFTFGNRHLTAEKPDGAGAVDLSELVRAPR
jgi:hypothetical protein